MQPLSTSAHNPLFSPAAPTGLKPVGLRLGLPVLRTLLALLLGSKHGHISCLTTAAALRSTMCHSVGQALRVSHKGSRDSSTSITREVTGAWNPTKGLLLHKLTGGLFGTIEHNCWHALNLMGCSTSQRASWVVVREIRTFMRKGRSYDRVSYLLLSGEQILNLA